MKSMTKIAIGLGTLTFSFAAQAEVRVQGGGATFPAPIYQRWVAEYQKAHPDVTVDYQSIGSGGGIKGITSRAFDFAGSDAPMSKTELAGAGGADTLIEIPTVAGAVVVAYNLPGFSGELKLDGPTVAEIYLGAIKTWNDPKIAALNPGVSLPATGIVAVHRADGSGTTYVFTRYLAGQSPEFNTKIGSAKQVEWPTGAGGPGNPGVAQIVKQTPGSIGYIELAFAIENKIPFAEMKNKDGKFIKATTEGVSLAGEGAVGGLKGDILAANIWNQPGEKSYPISSFTYIIVHKDLGGLKDPAKAKALVGFLRWALTDGEKIAPELYYAPLSEGVQKKALEALSHLTLDGKPVAQ
ncbi:MAG TPA: phosphate ABC transporter substrate-binding protein PstS [Tepidisphaeraceae bacterium]|jgi:phosphate transport system substrate-binding protein|nr:phosphate ABC transporter substrate-binding protein PstS [Tepidisphaeraceae bacterium]